MRYEVLADKSRAGLFVVFDTVANEIYESGLSYNDAASYAEQLNIDDADKDRLGGVSV